MKRLVVIVVAALVVVFVLWWLSAKPPKEPNYGGKSLSQWLNKYITQDRLGSEEDREQTRQAVRNIGTNALPVLLSWIRQEDARSQRAGWGVLQRFGGRAVDLRHALQKRSWAWFGFRILGAEAGPAIPELTSLLENDAPAMDIGTNGMTVAESAVSALGEIGVSAVPALSVAMTNRNIKVRQYAAQRLGELGPEARSSVPGLVAALGDGDPVVRLRALRALGQIHDRPELVVPALATNLSAAGDLQRRDAVSALRQFGAESGSALPQLLMVVSNKWEEPTVRAAAQETVDIILGMQPTTQIPKLPGEPGNQKGLR